MKTILLAILFSFITVTAYANQIGAGFYADTQNWVGAGQYTNNLRKETADRDKIPDSKAFMAQFGVELQTDIPMDVYWATIYRHGRWSNLLGLDFLKWESRYVFFKFGLAISSRQDKYLSSIGQAHIGFGVNFSDRLSLQYDHWSNCHSYCQPLFKALDIDGTGPNRGEDFISLIWKF